MQLASMVVLRGARSQKLTLTACTMVQLYVGTSPLGFIYPQRSVQALSALSEGAAVYHPTVREAVSERVSALSGKTRGGVERPTVRQPEPT